MCPLVIPIANIERRMASRKLGFRKLVGRFEIRFPNPISGGLVDLPLVVAAPWRSHRNRQRKAKHPGDRGSRVAVTINSRRQNRKDPALLFIQLIDQIDLPFQILTHVILVATVALGCESDKINPCRRGK